MAGLLGDQRTVLYNSLDPVFPETRWEMRMTMLKGPGMTDGADL